MTGGELVRIEMSKYTGYRHYHFDGYVIGGDTSGVWIAVPQGTSFDRPDHQFDTGFPQVIYVPVDATWIAHYFGFSALGKPPRHSIYVDVTTLPKWNADHNILHVVDLDLDVVMQNDGVLRIDDIDEFLAHKAANIYSTEVLALATETCLEVYHMLRQRNAPFDGCYDSWLAKMGAKSPLSEL